MTYRLFVPSQAVGASLVYFDLFNAATSGSRVQVISVQPIVDGATAVTGALAVNLFLTRTTAVGTAGTAAVRESTALTSTPSFTCLDGSESLPSGISARITPSGGATAGAVICMRSVFTEETSAGPYTPALDMVSSSIPAVSPALIVPLGTGIRVVQGAVASVGNIGFDVFFNVTPSPN